MIKLIGENINIISKSLGPAIRERRSTPILDIAKQMEYMDYIDLNIGPSKKDGAEVIEWLIKEVQSVSSKKLSIDTTNSEAMYTALRLLQDHSPLINSISLQPERLEEILPAAA
ncbi:MAG: dihydropteroate synthase, partial [Chloroflexi bacterium]|nr:dihydropteroate synthase [Chloroflexota bacterium]